MRRLMCGVLMLLALAACQRPERPVTTAVSTAEMASYDAVGTATLRGSAVLRQQGGGVVTCAGNRVLLMPDIPYTQEILRIIRDGGAPKGAGYAPRYPNAFRERTCDAQGFFEWRELAGGRWVVMTDVRWLVGYATHGGLLVSFVTVADGEDKEIVLSDANLYAR